MLRPMSALILGSQKLGLKNSDIDMSADTHTLFALMPEMWLSNMDKEGRVLKVEQYTLSAETTSVHWKSKLTRNWEGTNKSVWAQLF